MDYVTEEIARYSLSAVPTQQDEDGEGSRRTTGYSTKQAVRPSYASEKVKMSVVDRTPFAKVCSCQLCVQYSNIIRLSGSTVGKYSLHVGRITGSNPRKVWWILFGQKHLSQ